MSITLKPMSDNTYAFTPPLAATQAAAAGYIGRLRGDFGPYGTGFYSTWEDGSQSLKTPALKKLFDTIVNELRQGVLESREGMRAYCTQAPSAAFATRPGDDVYRYRFAEGDYTFYLRCWFAGSSDYNFYIFCYQTTKMMDNLDIAPADDNGIGCYAVVCCCDRNIEMIGIEASREEAFQLMKSDFIGCTGLSEEELQSKEADDGEDWELTTYEAYSNLHHLDVDWRIIRIDKADMRNAMLPEDRRGLDDRSGENQE